MGFIKRAVVVTSAVTVLLAVLIHRRIPDNVPHRNTIQLFVNYVSFIELLASITEKLGYNRWWPYRLSGSPPQSPKGMKVEHRHFAGVDCVIITPKSFQERSEPGPAIVFYHGGGFAFGDLAIYRNILTDMAEETGFLVMSPEYRVAPEHPFPIPYHDCINSTISFMRSTEQLNVNPKKIILAGDSAGGNLAMAVYIGLLQMNDSTLQLPAMQVLIYPMLQMINFKTPSYSHGDLMFSNNLAPKFLLAYIGLNHRLDLAEIVGRNGHFDKNDETFAKKWKLVSADAVPTKYKQKREYMGIEDTKYELPHDVRDFMKQMLLDTRVAPLLASDDIIRRIKKSVIMVCGHDPLRDDGVLLHERITSLNGKSELLYQPNSLHSAVHIGVLLKGSYYSEQNSLLFKAMQDGVK